MYGTEDAAAIWLDTWTEHITKAGYTTGISNPTLISDNDVKGLCHGDDFVIVGGRSNLIAFEKHMAEAFSLRRVGHIGMAEDTDTQITVLNRSIRVDRHRDLFEIEADERHVKKLAADLGGD